MIKSDQFFTIDLSKRNRSTFLVHQVERLNVSNAIIYYQDFHRALQFFRFVDHLDFTALNNPKFNAGKFLALFDQTKRHCKLIIKPYYFNKLKQESDIKKNKRVELVECRKRKKDGEEEQEEEDQHEQRGQQLISDIMTPLQESLSKYEKRLRDSVSSPSSQIPTCLSKFGITVDYRTMMFGLEDLIKGESVDQDVVSIGSSFLESILVSNDGSYVVVTKIEVNAAQKAIAEHFTKAVV